MTFRGPSVETYAQRRSALKNQLGRAVCFIAGPSEATYANDVHYRYRPDTNIRFLTGFEEPAHLLFSGCESDPGLTLFVRPRDPAAETWNGRRAGLEGARTHFGADHAYEIERWPAILAQHLKDADRFYWTQTRDPAINERVLAAIRSTNAERPRSGRSSLVIEDANLLIGEMRVVKDADGLAILRDACRLSALAHRAVMRAVQPEDHEFDVEALVEYLFRSAGCAGPAYGTIAAAGVNATVLHYTRNEDPLLDGELLLLDAGGEYGGFCGDITRTFPIGARYTAEQAKLYDIVLAAQKAAIAVVRPGATVDRVHREALTVLVAGLVEAGLLQGSVDTALENRTYERYYMHRTSHWLGMDVHDSGRYAVDGIPRKLEPGMVLTVEPGLYIPADDASEYRGIGIRIEDNVLVTDSGSEVLTEAAPKERDEIEALRRETLARTREDQRTPALRLK